MLNAVLNMDAATIWCGVIWAVVMGLAAGNYACSLIHRLPRGRLLLDKAPYCGSCMAPLQVKDLFPVLSALWLRHRCRYCGTSYPISHTVTELLVALLFVAAFFRHGFGDVGVLVISVGVFLTILGAIEVNEKRIMGSVMLCVLILGALLRTRVDGELFNFVNGGLNGVIVGALLWRKSITREGHIYRLPKQAELMAVAGVCVGASLLPLFLVLFAISYGMVAALAWAFNVPIKITIPFGIALLLPLLYPELNQLLSFFM